MVCPFGHVKVVVLGETKLQPAMWIERVGPRARADNRHTWPSGHFNYGGSGVGSRGNLMDQEIGNGCLVVLGFIIIGGLAIWKITELIASIGLYEWICK
jgi:hypothetical protein